MLTAKGFLDEHPGGAALLLKSAGQDATSDYDSIHNPDLISETLPESAFLGHINANIVTKHDEREVEKSKLQSPTLAGILNVDDFERVAYDNLSSTGWAYYASAADDEYSKQENARLYRMLTLRPRVLRKVSRISITTTILGKHSELPFYICPTGLGKYAHPNAECNLAAAAGKHGVIQVVPTSPSMSIESIVNARSSEQQPIFFQLYTNQDKAKTEAMIKRVERLGFSSLWITVDSPVLGKRERDDRLKGGSTKDERKPGLAKVSSSGLLNPNLCWEDLTWIKSQTKLPLVLKGIQTVDDAVLAYQNGVQGIVLSNHGGRSQDT